MYRVVHICKYFEERADMHQFSREHNAPCILVVHICNYFVERAVERVMAYLDEVSMDNVGKYLNIFSFTTATIFNKIDFFRLYTYMRSMQSPSISFQVSSIACLYLNCHNLVLRRGFMLKAIFVEQQQ